MPDLIELECTLRMQAIWARSLRCTARQHHNAGLYELAYREFDAAGMIYHAMRPLAKLMKLALQTHRLARRKAA